MKKSQIAIVRGFGLPTIIVLLAAVIGTGGLNNCCVAADAAGGPTATDTNLAGYATPSTSYVSGHETLDAINNGFEPRSMSDHRHGAYGNWPQTGKQWVEYRWTKPISTTQIAVYWWQDGQGIKLPVSSSLLYWDGNAYVPVPGAADVGVKGGAYQIASFPEITTDRLRLEFTGDGTFSTGILQWKVMDSGKSPKFAPTVDAGGDRVVVLPSSIQLHGRARGTAESIGWAKVSGPSDINFTDADRGSTTASFAQVGQYVLRCTAANGAASASADIHVSVEAAPMGHLDSVFTTRYSIDSPLWSDRNKQLIVHWIPHLIDELSKPDLKEGGISNFIEAANRIADKAYKPHMGYPWADAYTYNTVESMCVALQIDPRGDAEISSAQKMIGAKLEEWIPIILAAQEPDGYLQTRITLGLRNEYPHHPPRWTIHTEHEGYTAGYFMDAAVADYLMTDGKDRRMYNAAKKLADCWDNNIGPAPKKKWWDGHEEIEQSLVRFAHLVDKVEGPGKGDRYVALAKFLLSCRGTGGGGGDYDQTQAPVTKQYTAAGHAVRASYVYSAMTDIAMETGDSDYHTAVRSIWEDLVNRKYYVTGGIGSGETSEGFGAPYVLPNVAYCESCAGCGEIFFQHKMNMAYADAQYADLVEDTLYNAVLSDIDLTAENFTYTNSLDTSDSRYKWHDCPCCVGNIPRTLFELPTWMYATSGDDLYTNLFIGSTVNLDMKSGPVQIKQATDYPQSGHIEMTISPSTTRRFAVYVRIPNRGVSQLYQYAPAVDGVTSIAVNDVPIEPKIEKGYVRIDREWKQGDKITIELPMTIQRIHADERVVADRGKVALRYGPLVYTFEAVDQNVNNKLPEDAVLMARWEPNLLRGVTAIHGEFADGSQLTAIPYYARNNRGGRSTVWVADQ